MNTYIIYYIISILYILINKGSHAMTVPENYGKVLDT